MQTITRRKRQRYVWSSGTYLGGGFLHICDVGLHATLICVDAVEDGWDSPMVKIILEDKQLQQSAIVLTVRSKRGKTPSLLGCCSLKNKLSWRIIVMARSPGSRLIVSFWRWHGEGGRSFSSRSATGLKFKLYFWSSYMLMSSSYTLASNDSIFNPVLFLCALHHQIILSITLIMNMSYSPITIPLEAVNTVRHFSTSTTKNFSFY